MNMSELDSHSEGEPLYKVPSPTIICIICIICTIEILVMGMNRHVYDIDDLDQRFGLRKEKYSLALSLNHTK